MKELVLVLYTHLDDVICGILAWFLIDGDAHKAELLQSAAINSYYITYQYCKFEVSYMLKRTGFKC